MEDWERERMAAGIADHLLGIAAAAAVVAFVLGILAAQPGGMHYDAWLQACDAARGAAQGKAGPE